MENFDVIITCSGTGSRLLPITKHLNKSLVKLGDKAMLSHIIESYPGASRFIITVGHLKDQVIDYLKINHDNLNIVLVEVDDYDGPKSSLLYSLSKTFYLLDKPFFYNACDSYISSKKHFESNTAIVAEAIIGNQYRSVDKNIEDFSAEKGKLCYTGVAFIKDYKDFIKISSELLELSNNSLSDAHVLQKININFIKTDSWIDIGNFVSLKLARKNFESKICVLDKINQETYFINGKIVKFFDEPKKVEQLYQRSLELRDCVPFCDKSKHFIFYNWVEGETLSKILEPKLLEDFLNWCENTLWIPIENIDVNFFQNFYIQKAKDRVKLYCNKNNLDIENSDVEINFRKMKNINYLLNNISSSFNNSCRYRRAHGDLVFENVIKTSNEFILIDWRENFSPSNSSDMLYDIAKMKHNLYFDHSAISNGDFFIKQTNDNTFLFDSGINTKNLNLINQLNKWCLDKQIDINVIDLIMSLIQLSSSALHIGHDSQLLFYMGWYNLNKVLSDYESV